MSEVNTKYSAVPTQNTSLGGISLKENETRFRDINDLIRKLMADVKEESGEIRTLTAGATSIAADARAIAQSAQSDLEAIAATAGSVAEQASAAQSDAQTALDTALAAQDTAEGISARVASAEASATSNSSRINALSNRVSSLENAASSSATLVQVDSVSVSNTNGVLKAVDVLVGESTATARGQIGRTKVSSGANLDAIVDDGWYAIGGENVSGLPSGVLSGICRVSAGYAADSIFQSLFVPGETPRMFVRSTEDGGEVWGEWHEAVFAGSIGSGLTFVGGVLSADMSDVLPEAGEDDADKALSGAGAWMEVAHPSDVQAAFEAVSALEESFDALKAEVEALQAGVLAEPDGETITVENGQFVVIQYGGATSETAGTAGIVPAAPAGSEGFFLRGDGEWADPQMSTASFSGEEAGLVPPSEESERGLYLKGDGSWGDPAAAVSDRVEVLEGLDLTHYGERLAALEETAGSEDIDALFAVYGEGEGGGE